MIDGSGKPRFLIAVFALWALLAQTGAAQTTATERVAQARPAFEEKRILFLGDSITANGTYVSIIEYYMTRNHPENPPDIISIGLASETVSGLSEKPHPFPRPCLLERLDRAMQKGEPGIVVASYGMNDGIYHPQNEERFDAFKNGMLSLIEKTRSAGVPLILLTPPPFDPLPIAERTRADGAGEFGYKTPYQRYDTVLTGYSRWMMSRQAEGVTVIDINRPLTRYLAHRRRENPEFTLSSDGVHPDMLGHLLMARAFMRGFDIEYVRGNAEEEKTRLEADPLFRLVDERRRRRSRGWLNYVGYTRGDKVETPEIATTESLAAESQAEIVQLIKDYSSSSTQPANVSEATPATMGQ